MNESKIQELVAKANSKGPDGSYDIRTEKLDSLASTPEGKEAVKRAKAQRED